MCPYCTKRKQAYSHEELCSVKHRCGGVLVRTQCRYQDGKPIERNRPQVTRTLVEALLLLEHEEPDSESASIHDHHSHIQSVGIKETLIVSFGEF